MIGPGLPSAEYLTGLRQSLLQLGGVKLYSDLYERTASLGPSFPMPLDAKRRQRLCSIADAGALFVHIPKNAGMAVSQALYGRQIYHASIRFYHRYAPALVARLPSFAIWRDPIERFLSAVRFARTNGNAGNRIAAGFRDAYARFADIDAVLDHIEAARSVFDLDHIFRPQFWYVSDRRARIAVDRVILIDELDATLADMDIHLLERVPHINESVAFDIALTTEQDHRLRRLFAIDFAIHEALLSRAMPAVLNGPPTRKRAV